MHKKFKGFLNSIQPPPDGTYLFRVRDVRTGTYDLRVTLEVIDGDHMGRVIAVPLHHVHDLQVLQQFVRAIDAEAVEDEQQLRGRMLYAAIRRGESRLFLSRPERYEPQDGGPAPDRS
jgi:hypothetical protein